MGAAIEALLERVQAARAGLAAAVAAQDPYEVAAAQDELDDAVRFARRHGLDVDVDQSDKG
ncbi:hypothetical protein OG381_01570 [Streptomyces sp. NBC_00490]|uniref:hypothetical protein n=1 Tax=Streptomyces sp. NBC_00490 TaxID=2903657 RepID=UPI002E198156